MDNQMAMEWSHPVIKVLGAFMGKIAGENIPTTFEQ
jgi:hypothetical protein